MNRKKIAKRLTKVFKEWVESIDDKETQKLVRKNSIISGGAIVSLLNGEEPKDYDVYFKNKETVLAVAKYYVEKFNERTTITNNCGYTGQKAFVLDGAGDIDEQVRDAGEKNWVSRMIHNLTEDRVKIIVRSDGIAEEEPPKEPETLIEEGDELNEEVMDLEKTKASKKEKKELPKYRPIFLSTNAITLSDKIQLIIRFYGDPEGIYATYDFAHCLNHWCSNDSSNVRCTVDSLEAIHTKQLIYLGSRYPVCSLFRIRKFLSRGYTINAGQILKMAMQISEIDLTDIDTLEDQLIGVDTLYFQHFIDMVRSAQELSKKHDKDFTIDLTYVATVVDKIFN